MRCSCSFAIADEAASPRKGSNLHSAALKRPDMHEGRSAIHRNGLPDYAD
jgi:hypothetical protein